MKMGLAVGLSVTVLVVTAGCGTTTSPPDYLAHEDGVSAGSTYPTAWDTLSSDCTQQGGKLVAIVDFISTDLGKHGQSTTRLQAMTDLTTTVSSLPHPTDCRGPAAALLTIAEE